MYININGAGLFSIYSDFSQKYPAPFYKICTKNAPKMH